MNRRMMMIQSLSNKKCFKCSQVKPLSMFYKHSEMADGHLNKCIECTKEDTKIHYRNNIQHYADYDKKREALEKRKMDKMAVQRTHRAKHPERYAAHQKVMRAIKAGRIQKKPCEVCGDHKVDAHHEDYNKPLNVTWLCQKHHFEIHGKRSRTN